MATHERDPVSGQRTTGHEWDGIKELQTPIPNWWLLTFVVTWIIAVGCLVLFPSFATTRDYAKGLLGWSSHGQFEASMSAARDAQSSWRAQLLATPLADVEANEDLRRFAVAGGQAAFNENCAGCHGVGAGGQIGQFPALVDDDWLWGGTIDAIHQTIQHGIRSASPDTRESEMPAFGGLLSSEEIAATADFVLTLSRPEGADAGLPGAALFADNCSGCHGPQGQGGRDFGAPRLNDAIWLYGGAKPDIVAQITKPRMGQMPAWQGRLDPVTMRMLAVYVHTLGGGER